jgi:hypothetical protein
VVLAVTRERPAEPGETCDCGRPAVVVFVTARWGDVAYCGVPAPERNRTRPRPPAGFPRGEPERDAEPVSADCRGGRHPVLVSGGGVPCVDCACWCHAGEPLRRP